ncbi:MAG: hypothetical protein IPM49_02285 [Flavobacteriales bacterium]|nr:hypothetical protein [Flavobacteriales bacterium]
MATESEADGAPKETDPAAFLHGLVNALSDYATAEKKRLTLNAAMRAGDGLARVLLIVVVLLAVSGVVLMLSVAWALLLARWLDDPVLGFAFSAVTYVVLGLAFYLLWRTVLRDRIILSIVNSAHDRS